MNIAIVTTVYNGYGRFVHRWLESIAESGTLPDQVVVALGKSHRFYGAERMREKFPQLNLQFHYTLAEPLMGPMRNAAVAQTETEWVMYLSVDDMLLPGAIDELARYEKNADYICIKWLSKATWRRSRILVHNPKTPEEMATIYGGKGFIVGHSPFRRSFWEQHPYKPHDYPNAPFVADLVEAGARFATTQEPCTIYLRRLQSHAARLGRRGRKPTRLDPREKAQANRWKNNMQKRIREYYGKNS